MSEPAPLIPVVAVVGPTASGKSALAVELARLLNGEIVSADSKQIYRYMSVGTAVPTEEEMAGIPHHLLQFLNPDQNFSVAEYVELAQKAILEIHARKKLPVVAGGTGLYVSSLLDNITFFDTKSDPALRQELEQTAAEKGNQYLLDLLNTFDPQLAQKLHPNNLGRIIRGIEAYRLTGIPMSEHQKASRQKESPYRCCIIGLNYRNRDLLYQRIDRRVEKMMENGLLEEIKELIRMGYSQTAAQAIGYKEFFGYLQGKSALEESVARVQQESRRYAKRQLTWFRRDERVNWLYIDDYEDYNSLVKQALALAENQLGVSA
ncbi:MAG TPA: tRNA (adenosine(37)-N6)-dimethylallyltransferase MiaA [Ruminococcaceae bacterium]|nr:tRNA (adenosine(37)-N6)-dimethylallyltransferase MiaA [Oscillospiraceae bacterium]MDD5920047.1 tRNA (adenosine(37)-N6)-dimethylallyltransferase MiaA [Oscillospiraceae bacterium]HAO69733.1 tRNA (adenosine(37)-N6)-dimethylallyltransferase MiaA [Oscillospiraceae bacterium]HCB64946.1 tRNA (adenosine(37)-N6)-dimethylallyltransferase MiaA [Oscillospiraceae bacterium]